MQFLEELHILKHTGPRSKFLQLLERKDVSELAAKCGGDDEALWPAEVALPGVVKIVRAHD